MRTLNCFLPLALAGLLTQDALSAQERAPDGTLPQPFLALTRANVVDVRTGRILTDRTVLVRNGLIEAIGTTLPPAEARVIDLRGRYLLPGLMDAHTHLDNLAATRRALESGVTTARSASVAAFQDVALRDLVRRGFLAGPDILAAGVFVSPDLGESLLADPALGALITGVRTPAQLRQLVRVNLDRGVDVIKTRGTERAGLPNTDPRQQTYSETELRAVVEEAATKNIPVLAHAHGDEGAYAAVSAGVRSIEHGTYLSDSTLALMKQQGTFLVPTYSTLLDLGAPGGDYDDPVLTIRAGHMIPRMEATVRRAHAIGVKLVTGGDTRYGPESITRVSHEIANLVSLGLTPLLALQGATTLAADLFGIARRTGAVEVGLEADLIAVEGNPLENIRAVQDVLLVISNGRVALDRLTFSRK